MNWILWIAGAVALFGPMIGVVMLWRKTRESRSHEARATHWMNESLDLAERVRKLEFELMLMRNELEGRGTLAMRPWKP